MANKYNIDDVVINLNLIANRLTELTRLVADQHKPSFAKQVTKFLQAVYPLAILLLLLCAGIDQKKVMLLVDSSTDLLNSVSSFVMRD